MAGRRSTLSVPLSTKPITDSYEVNREAPVGRGTTSSVFLARHIASQEVVVIKEMHWSSARERASFVTEVAMCDRVRKLAHPGLIQMREAYIDKARQLVIQVLPFLRGGMLFDRVAETEDFCEAFACGVFREIVKAVAALHAAGIVHRDLKPENVVMLSTHSLSTDLVVIDFGLAKCAELPDFFTGVGMGTPGYKAPEVLVAPPQYTPACDVWSLGVILYVLLSGCKPIEGKLPWTTAQNRETNRETITQRTLRGDYWFPEEQFSQVSEEAKDVIRRCMTVDPAKRITCNELLKLPWMSNDNAPTEALGGKYNMRLKAMLARRRLRHMIFVGLAWQHKRKCLLQERIDKLSKDVTFTPNELELLLVALRRAVPKNDVTRMTVSRIKTVMQVLGYNHMPLDELLDAHDPTGESYLDYNEFVVALSRHFSTRSAHSRLMFRVYDPELTGRLDFEQFCSLLAAADPDHLAGDDRVDSVMDVFRHIDTDGDGFIDLDEFEAAIEGIDDLRKAFLLDNRGPVGDSFGSSRVGVATEQLAQHVPQQAQGEGEGSAATAEADAGLGVNGAGSQGVARRVRPPKLGEEPQLKEAMEAHNLTEEVVGVLASAQELMETGARSRRIHQGKSKAKLERGTSKRVRKRPSRARRLAEGIQNGFRNLVHTSSYHRMKAKGGGKE